MIVLHRIPNHIPSKELEEKLKDLVISYKIREHGAEDDNLPFIEEDGIIYSSEEELGNWLMELKSDLSWQRSLSGDGCYIDPKKGNVC